ncbi:MAG TPA: hypothetical protein VG387_01430 [Rhizomicrobium sp.]|jgi:hypothetical protein|nr:hypothetical protein [Rhizomicrobium sp.]
MLRRFLLGLAGLLAASGAAQAVDTGYHGKDAGALVFAAGTLDRNQEVIFYFRKAGQSSWLPSFDGVISYKPDWVAFRTPDFTGHEDGDVTIDYLEPGDYEVYGYGDPGNALRIRSTISIPFTIHAGQTVYIGDFAGLGIVGKDFLGIPVKTGAIFVVSDKHERDLAIAAKRDPQLGPVAMAVPDAARLGDPAIVAAEPH